MILYLDASVIVPLFVKDQFNQASDLIVRNWRTEIAVSDFAAAEFASALARRVRLGELTRSEGTSALTNFDAWVADAAASVHIGSQDIASATSLMRQFDWPPRTGDAIHIAAAQRLGSALATFDLQMARSARALGLSVLQA